jgi:predicted TIM-barrel enzyme
VAAARSARNATPTPSSIDNSAIIFCQMKIILSTLMIQSSGPPIPSADTLRYAVRSRPKANGFMGQILKIATPL